MNEIQGIGDIPLRFSLLESKPIEELFSPEILFPDDKVVRNQLQENRNVIDRFKNNNDNRILHF